MAAPDRLRRFVDSPLIRAVGAGCLLGVVTIVSYASAYLLRFNGEVPADSRSVFAATVGWFVAVRLGVAVWMRQGLMLNRYFSFLDALRLVQAVSLGTVAATLLDALFWPGVTVPRSVLLLDWGATLVLLAAVHSVPRFLSDARWRFTTKDRLAPAIIVGANDAGEGLLRAIKRSPSLGYELVGFVDDRPRSRDVRIAGKPVLGRIADLPVLIKKHAVEQVLITSGELPGRQVRELMDVAGAYGCTIRVLPSYEQLLREDVAVKPREVAIADLLRRQPVRLDDDKLHDWLRDKVVMVTGSAGSIGSEIASQLLALGPAKLVLVDRSETGQFFLERQLAAEHPGADFEVVLADLTDRARLDAVFGSRRPDVLFHAAAYKHVPLMEANPGEAVKNIVHATRNCVDLAEEHGAERFVMISTDKAVNPTSVMGACKRVAEQYVQAKAASSRCRMSTVRFGNVLDSAGSVVPIFRQQIAEGGPVTVTHPDMVRYFMLIPEAAQLVVQAGLLGEGGEVFVLDMGEPVRLMDLARDMIRLSGLKEGRDIEIQISGLRPGEKLYEELYDAHEQHCPTEHKKIMVAASSPRNLLEVIADVNRLVANADEPEDVLRGVLAEVSPLATPAAVGQPGLERAA